MTKTKTKIKIPQNVADAIKYLKKEGYPTHQIVRNALNENWCNEPEENNVDIEIINGMDPEALVFAIHGMYVIKPELEVGDWVKSKVTGDIGRVTEIKRSGDVVTDVQLVGYRKDFFLTNKSFMFEKQTIEEIRQEKERRLWKSIEREPGEIKEGDIGENNTGTLIFSKSEIEFAYKHDALKGLFPIEKFVCFWGDGDE